MKRAVLGLVVVVTLLSGLVPGLSASASAADPSARSASYAADARAATNAVRRGNGERSLVVQSCVQRAAQRQATRMARAGRLFHSPDFTKVGRRCGLRTWGENVALNRGDGRSVVRQWMGSSGHRANILRRDYRVLGLAAVHRNGAWWVVQVFGRTM